MPTSDNPSTPLLLDTHIWVWALEQQEAGLSHAALRAINVASSESNVCISAISMWEVAMLTEKGRLNLSAEPLAWLERAAGGPGLQVIDLTPRIVVESTRLPGNPHGDPADRIIMATARDVGARLVTRDRHILRYAATSRALLVLDATP